MRIRNHHHVSRGIGVAVQDHEIFPGAQDDQGLGIIAPFRCGAKNARLVFHASGDIAVPPGRPEIIHDDGDYCGGVWGGTAAAAAAVSPLTKSLSSLLGLKNGMRLGGTSTLAPVFGLRPVRPRRWRVRKLPKPRISIRSPPCSAPMMLSKMVSTMASDSLRPSSVTRTTSSTRSALVTVESFIDVCSAESRIAPEGAWAYCAEPARHPLAENTPPGEPPLVAFQYHQTSVKGNNIYCPGRGAAGASTGNAWPLWRHRSSFL